MKPNDLALKSIVTHCLLLRRYTSRKSTAVTSTEYCLDLIKKHDHENFLCTLLLPQPIRSAAVAVRAFNVEVSKASLASKDPKIALMRLKFWDETIDRIYAGNPPNQPVALELTRAVTKHGLKKRQFTRLIKAREKQLEESCFQTLEKMEAYSEETVSPIIYLTLESAGIKNIHADHAASHVGKGQGLALLLRVAGSGGGSWSLPKDLLELSGHSLSAGISPNSASSKDIIFKIASRAKAHIDKARSLKTSLPKGSSVHLLPAISTEHYLNRLRDADFDVFEPMLKERDVRLGLSLFWGKLMTFF